MSEIIKVSKIQFRQDTSNNWGAINPILANGEPAWDGQNFKIGDGVSTWTALPTLSSTNIISDVIDDGKKYIRTRPIGAAQGIWQEIDNRKDLKDLLSANYNIEIDMGYRIRLPDASERQVYGIRKYFSPITVDAGVIDTQTIVANANSIINASGSYSVGDGRTYLIGGNNPNHFANVYLDGTNAIKIETKSNLDRVNTLIDVWVLYTKN